MHLQLPWLTSTAFHHKAFVSSYKKFALLKLRSVENSVVILDELIIFLHKYIYHIPLTIGRHMLNTCTIGLIMFVLSSLASLASSFIIYADNLLFACSMYFLAYMSFLINFLYFIGEVVLFGTADWTFGIVSPSVISGKLDLGS